MVWGVKFICTQNWCICRPRTTQLDPVSVNTDTPALAHTLTNAAEEETDSRPTLFSLFFSSSSPFLLLLLPPSLSQDLLHSVGRVFFSNYRLEVPESRRRKMRTGMSAGMLLCVHVCV